MTDTPVTRDDLLAGIDASSRTISTLADHAPTIHAAGTAIIDCLNAGGKVLTAGNGGSAAEAMHLAEEFVGRFCRERRSLPAIALTADSTALTCIGNDYGYDAVFSRQVEGLGVAGDILILFSTSGNAANLREAARVARERGLRVVSLLGKSGGPLAGQGDFEVVVASDDTARIQEAHQVILHLLLEMVDVAFA